MEVPRLRVKSGLYLYHGNRNLNPLSKARYPTPVLMDPSQVRYHWATTGTPSSELLAVHTRESGVLTTLECWLSTRVGVEFFSMLRNVGLGPVCGNSGWGSAWWRWSCRITSLKCLLRGTPSPITPGPSVVPSFSTCACVCTHTHTHTLTIFSWVSPRQFQFSFIHFFINKYSLFPGSAPSNLIFPNTRAKSGENMEWVALSARLPAEMTHLRMCVQDISEAQFSRTPPQMSNTFVLPRQLPCPQSLLGE